MNHSRDLSGDMVCPGFVQREMRYQSDKVLYEIGFWSSIMYCFGPENDPNLYSTCFYQISTRPAFTKSLLDLLLVGFGKKQENNITDVNIFTCPV